MNSNILNILDIEIARIMTNKIINLYVPLKKEPFGFVDIKNGVISAHFGYFKSINYTKHFVS